MQDFIKFTVYKKSDGSIYRVLIEVFLHGSIAKRFYLRSIDWFLPMILKHAPFHILDNIFPHRSIYYCFDSPDYPMCLCALFAILEEHQEDIEEDLPF